METLRTLLREYAAHLNATTPGGKHVCLESYEKELGSLPGAYAQPEGTLLLPPHAQERRESNKQDLNPRIPDWPSGAN